MPLLAAAMLLFVLRDPPWLGRVTSGLSPWMHEAGGTRFRWTTGHATFYVPVEHQAIEVPLRAYRFSPDFLPVTARLHVDGRLVEAIRLEDDTWRHVLVRVGLLPATRRYRRIEVRVNRTYGRFFRGVKLGEIKATR